MSPSDRAGARTIAALALALTAGCATAFQHHIYEFSGTAFAGGGFSVIAHPAYKGVSIEFQNKTATPIHIVWAESAYLDMEGKSHRVVHRGPKPDGLDDSGKPTPIAAGASLIDLVIAEDLISEEEGKRVIGDHLPTGYAAKESVGRSVTLYLVVKTPTPHPFPIRMTMKVGAAKARAAEDDS